MKAYKDFIVSPIGERYNNSKKVGDKELILNTEIFNHQFINRLALILETPILFSTPINKGDEVILHHNVFRRFRDVRGDEKNSKSYYSEDLFFAQPDQIYAYKHNLEWQCVDGFCFIKPIKNTFNNLRNTFIKTASER